MAITIKNIPVLEGVTAEDFVRSADKNAAKVTPRLSVEAKKRLRKVLEKSFIPVQLTAMDGISLYDDCVMLAYNKEVRRNCLPFTCGENDLDDFFLNDADLYADELLGKTYCWVTTEIPLVYLVQ